MLEAFSTPQSRRQMLLLFAVCGVLAGAAGAVGIDDNPLGVALAFLSAIALVLAFAHPWRSSMGVVGAVVMAGRERLARAEPPA